MGMKQVRVSTGVNEGKLWKSEQQRRSKSDRIGEVTVGRPLDG